MSDYDAYARRIIASGVLSDPWIDGQPRFRQLPITISAERAKELYRAAEDVAAVYNELCQIVAEEERFLDDFFCLTPVQKAMWTASAPHWHGLARADVFVTDDGLAFTEINCDTPTGEAEAGGWCSAPSRGKMAIRESIRISILEAPASAP